MSLKGQSNSNEKLEVGEFLSSQASFSLKIDTLHEKNLFQFVSLHGVRGS